MPRSCSPQDGCPSKPQNLFRSLKLLSLPTLMIALAAPAAAHADEALDDRIEELQAVGLGQSRGDPIPVPADAPLRHSPDEPQEAKQGVLFVNMDGATMSSGWDNSKTNTTQISQLVGSFAAYGQGNKRDAVMQAVNADWEPFNVQIVSTRPNSGDYTMCMVGPTNPFGGGVLGIAPLDCNDSQTHNNITYAFHSVNDSFSATVTATTIGQEVAHSYGLEHVGNESDIMNPYNAGGDAYFWDTCIALAQNGASCGSQHAAQCGSSSQQNSFQELMEIFGPGTPDTVAPTVLITYPTDGEEFEAGASFTLTVDASDDNEVQQVELYYNDDLFGPDGSAPYGWEVESIPAGTYTFYVVASDMAGNTTESNTVTIGVGGASPTTSGDDSADSGDSGDDGGDGDSGAITTGDSDGLPPGFGEARGEEVGCACAVRSDRPLGMLLGLIGLGLLGLRRRAQNRP